MLNKHILAINKPTVSISEKKKTSEDFSTYLAL